MADLCCAQLRTDHSASLVMCELACFLFHVTCTFAMALFLVNAWRRLLGSRGALDFLEPRVCEHAIWLVHHAMLNNGYMRQGTRV